MSDVEKSDKLDAPKPDAAPGSQPAKPQPAKPQPAEPQAGASAPEHSVAPGGRRATAFSPREWEIVVLSPPQRIAKANRVTANRVTATPAPAA